MNASHCRRNRNLLKPLSDVLKLNTAVRLCLEVYSEGRIKPTFLPTGLSAEKQQEMKLKAEKDRLLGQITHYYRESGKEVPFGLASCSKEQLKRHLEHVKGMKKA